jgi:hypothetical protein
MSIRNKLDNLGAQFGGYSELVSFLNPLDLYKVSNFPGAILVTSNASLLNLTEDPDDIDLTSLGYIPNTTYRVYDKNFKFLYEAQAERWFGENNLDASLALELEHGEYFYIKYQTVSNIQEVALVWVTARLSKTDSDLMLRVIAAEVENNQKAQTKLVESELFIYSEVYTGSVTVYLLPGSLQSQPPIQDFLTSPLSTSIVFNSKKGQLFKNLAGHWLLIAVTPTEDNPTPEDLLVWSVSQGFGSGAERIFRKPEGPVYISSNSLNRISLTESRQQFLSSSLVAQLKLDKIIQPLVTQEFSLLIEPFIDFITEELITIDWQLIEVTVVTTDFTSPTSLYGVSNQEFTSIDPPDDNELYPNTFTSAEYPEVLHVAEYTFVSGNPEVDNELRPQVFNTADGGSHNVEVFYDTPRLINQAN